MTSKKVLEKAVKEQARIIAVRDEVINQQNAKIADLERTDRERLKLLIDKNELIAIQHKDITNLKTRIGNLRTQMGLTGSLGMLVVPRLL